MAQIWIVKTGSTFPELRALRGDYEDWIADGMKIPRERLRVVSVSDGEDLPRPDTPAGVVVTGSSAMVSHREPWSERTAAWLRNAVEAETPVLGICYGHQLLAHALGGDVGPNLRGREIGSVELEVCPDVAVDPILGSAGERGPVQATHVESVLALPPGVRRLAATALDPNHAFVAGEHAWGVQFHPEFDAEVMRFYLRERREILRSEGLDAGAIAEAVVETPFGPRVLQRFAESVGLPEEEPAASDG